jgi:hypothetical protein
MEFTSIGGGVMIALAAGLWLMYLVPNWLKNREYLATERNAVRLQQTIRVLAQTSELPEEVRAEAVARRAAALAQARTHQGPVAVGRAVTPATREQAFALSGRRLRRTRAFTSLALLASMVVAGIQLSFILTSGAVSGTWLVLATATIAGISASAMLSRLAERSRARSTEHAPATRTAAERRRVVRSSEAPAAQQTAQVSWTPVPVPKPMYLARNNPLEAAVAAARHAGEIDTELRVAAESAERALRANTAAMAAATREAELARDAKPVTVPAAPAPNRFAGMGIVDIDGSALDLDAALARRRRAS